MPCDYKEYPENWKWLSKQIVKDAGNKCELCYAPNGVTVNRSKHGQYPWELAYQDGGKETRIVLTVHHIDSDKKNNTKQNLIALCQRCHLRLDLQKHMKNRKMARQEKEANLQLLTAPSHNSASTQNAQLALELDSQAHSACDCANVV